MLHALHPANASDDGIVLSLVGTQKSREKVVVSEKMPCSGRPFYRKSKEPARTGRNPAKNYWVHRLTFNDELDEDMKGAANHRR
jgi:hypothetical protein